jgi:hypothetical protein
MKTSYEYINFVEWTTKKKTSEWVCYNNNHDYTLGFVRWYPPWRQYCFFPSYDMLFNKSCMLDIIDFINQLMEERKNAIAKRNKKD